MSDNEDALGEDYDCETYDDNGDPESDEDAVSDEEGLSDDETLQSQVPAKVPKGNIAAPVLGIGDARRLSMRLMTVYEKSRIISARAKQLASGLPPMDPETKLEDPIEIAESEFYNDTIPIRIRRPMPNGTIEKFSVTELKKPRN